MAIYHGAAAQGGTKHQINRTSHGLVTYQVCDINGQTTGAPAGLVTSVIDADNVEISLHGIISAPEADWQGVTIDSASLVAGTRYYVANADAAKVTSDQSAGGALAFTAISTTDVAVNFINSTPMVQSVDSGELWRLHINADDSIGALGMTNA